MFNVDGYSEVSVNSAFVMWLLDSESSATREISAFFPDFNVKQFYENVEANFRLSRVMFDTESRTHKIH